MPMVLWAPERSAWPDRLSCRRRAERWQDARGHPGGLAGPRGRNAGHSRKRGLMPSRSAIDARLLVGRLAETESPPDRRAWYHQTCWARPSPHSLPLHGRSWHCGYETAVVGKNGCMPNLRPLFESPSGGSVTCIVAVRGFGLRRAHGCNSPEFGFCLSAADGRRTNYRRTTHV